MRLTWAGKLFMASMATYVAADVYSAFNDSDGGGGRISVDCPNCRSSLLVTQFGDTECCCCGHEFRVTPQ